MFDPFSRIPEKAKIKTVEKTVYVTRNDYILGIESRMFFGIFYGILVTLIFISIMAYAEE
ncbi:MAG: hypothetical protein OIN66_11710 [Candidatus Methanoperedens sp.]|nr:hypothetical protein [Candidatus Methanoperedens sp.]